MKTYPKYCYYLLVLLLPLSVIAQTREEGAEWGVYQDWEINMTSYDQDTIAPAVVLYEKGITFKDLDRNNFSTYRRIKILDAAIFDTYGTIEIFYTNEQVVQKLEAKISYVDEYGTSVTHQLGESDFLKVEAASTNKFELNKITFTFPFMQVGAILEYRYEILDGGKSSWVFENDIPTLWSEYIRIVPPTFTYASYALGDTDYFVNAQSRQNIGGNQYIVNQIVMRNVPASIIEPLMPTFNSFGTQVGYFLKSYKDEFLWDPIIVFENWPDEATKFSEYIENTLEGKRSVREKVGEVLTEAGVSTDLERMVVLYEYVRDKIETNGFNNIYVGSDKPDRVISKGRATASEKNTLLLDMLRIAGLKADPVLYRNRSKGPISEFITSVSLFDRLIAQVKIEGRSYYLDASNPNRPWNILAEEALVTDAFVIEKELDNNYHFVDLSSLGVHRSNMNVSATIHEDGVLTAQVSTTDIGHAALEIRSGWDLSESSLESIVEELIIKDVDGIELSEVEIANFDEVSLPIKSTFKAEIEGVVEFRGNLIYISPFVLPDNEYDAFNADIREHDIDLIYKKQRHYILTLEIPEGYVIEDLPESKQLAILDGAVMMQRSVLTNRNSVQIILQEKWNRSYFSVEEYPALKAYFDQVLKLRKEVIVLKTIGAESASVAQSEDDPPISNDGN